MKIIIPTKGNVVLKQFKDQEENKSGVLIVPDNKNTKIYEVFETWDDGNFSIGDKVLIKGYPTTIQLDHDLIYYLVEENEIIGVIRDI